MATGERHRPWKPFGYSPLVVLKRFAMMLAFILAGVLVIFAIEWIYNQYLGSLFNFVPTQTDWDTVAAIWVAEIPLAFLLTTLLERRRILREKRNDDFSNLVMIMEKRRVADSNGDEFGHLKYLKVVKQRRLLGDKVVQEWLLNSDTGEAYGVMFTRRYGYLAEEGLIDRRFFFSVREFEGFCKKKCIHRNLEGNPELEFWMLRPDFNARKRRERGSVGDCGQRRRPRCGTESCGHIRVQQVRLSRHRAGHAGPWRRLIPFLKRADDRL